MKTRDLGNLVIVADNEDDLDHIENTIASLARGTYQRDLARGLHGLKHLVVGMHDAILAEHCAG